MNFQKRPVIEDSISSKDFCLAGDNNPVGFGNNQGQLLFLYFVQPPTTNIYKCPKKKFFCNLSRCHFGRFLSLKNKKD